MVTKKINNLTIIIGVSAAVLLSSGCMSDISQSPQDAEIPASPSPTASPSPEPLITAEEISDADFTDYDNKSSGWGFKKIKDSEPDIPGKIIEMFRKYNTFYIDDKREKTLYLTFDEGYENGYTAQILDVLKKYNIPAAFFITGPYLERESELVKRMVNEGHIVGNHTVHHPNLPKLTSAKKMAEELCSLNEQFVSHFGFSMRYMRPPEGEYSERLLAVANTLGYKTVFWSFAYRDWDPSAQKGSSYAFEQVTPYLHNGAILLLHAVSKDNADALENIIQFALNSGYKFKSINEIVTNT